MSVSSDIVLSYKQIINRKCAKEIRRDKTGPTTYNLWAVNIMLYYGSHADEWEIFYGCGNTEEEAERDATKEFNNWVRDSDYAQWFRDDIKAMKGLKS